MRSVTLALCMLLVSGAAFAQSPAPADQGQTAAPTAAAPTTPAPSTKKAANPRRVQCQQDGRAKGLKGSDLRSSVKDCVAAANTSCRQKASDQNLKGSARRDFMKTCVS